MFKKILFLLALCAHTVIFSQKNITVKNILNKTEKYYMAQNEYNYISAYKLYENKNSKKPIEEKLGVILRTNKISYQKMEFTETFNFGNQAMVIDNKNKIIYISDKLPKESVFSFSSYLKKFPISRIINHTKYWICEMKVSQNTLSQYNTIRFYVNKDDNSLYKQVFYIDGNQEIISNGKEINLENPRLEIILRKKKFSLEENLKIKKDNYFTFSKGKIVLSKKYKNFKVISN